jgi:hypothetical protein
MTTEEIQLETLILVAVGKLYSEQSTYLIKEYKQKTKFNFNVSVSGIDGFIKGIEANLTESEKAFLQELTDCMLNGLTDMKKELKPKPEIEEIHPAQLAS